MIPQVLSHYHLPMLSCVGLLLFIGVFASAVAWVYRSGGQSYYASIGSLPLVEDSSAKPSETGKEF